MPYRHLITVAAILLGAAPAIAEEPEVPYWASIRAKEVNMRVGPGEDYRINWVYHRKLLPLKVVRTMEGWRLVQDPEGSRGWMLARFLSRERGAIVKKGPPAEMHEQPEDGSRLMWKLESGVTGKLGDCDAGWCRFEIEGHGRGYVRQDALWGAGEP
jgi:SH3-like domain-containing protein